MAATSSGHRAAILREVSLEMNRTDDNASTPPRFADYASDVARRLIDLANAENNPPTATLPDGAPDAVPLNAGLPRGVQVCARHDRRAFRHEGRLLHLMDETPCV